MSTFWQKPIFWTVLLVILIVLIPLSFYLFKPQILSSLPYLSSKTQPAKTTKLTVKPGSCLVLEEKYCSQAEVIDWTGPTGQKGKMIGFHLPPEVPLFMPIDGQVAKAKLPDGVINGFEAIVFNPSDKTLRYIFDGDLQFDNMFSLNMKKGDVFGHTGKTGIENAGSSNVLFYILRGTRKETVNAEDEMKIMFQSIKL